MKKQFLFLLLFVTTLAFSQTTTTPLGSIKHNNQLTLNNTADTLLVRNPKTKMIEGVLKSSIKDVLEYNSAINLPVTGAVGKIYVTKDNNKIYRWNGTFYQELAVTDISGKINVSEKGAINGVATLGSDGKVPNSQIPALAISETFPVSSQAQMLALSQADQGDVAIRSDISKSFILRVSPSSVLANWSELLSPTDAVTSVAGKVGVVTLNTSDIGGLQTALNGKENTFSKNTAFNKNFGTTAGTVADGGTLGTNAYTSTAYQPILTNPVTGIGTTNYISKFTGASTLGNSLIFDSGTNVGIGTDSPQFKFDVRGNIGSIGDGNGFAFGDFTSAKGLFSIKSILGRSISIDDDFAGVNIATISNSGTFINSTIQALPATTDAKLPTLGQVKGITDFKIDKVAGKSLSDENYTLVEKNKLAGLSNFDPTTINNAVANKVDKVTGKSLIADSEITRLATVTNQDISGKFDKTGGTISGNVNVTGTVTATSFNGSATLTGTPTAPTATAGTNTTQIATTAFVAGGLATKENTFSKNTAFNKNFGTTSGTVVEGGTLGTNAYSSTVIPTNTNQLTNGSGYITDISGKVDKVTGKSLISDSEITRLATVTNQDISGKFDKTGGTISGNVNVTGTVTATSFNGSATLTGTPTAPTAPAGTNTTQIATTAFVQSNSRPYKVYTALLTQTDTNAPVATVLENTLGTTLTFAYSSTGNYTATLGTGLFLASKTTTQSNFGKNFPSSESLTSNILVANGNSTLVILALSNGVRKDSIFTNQFIEIRVYP